MDNDQSDRRDRPESDSPPEPGPDSPPEPTAEGQELAANEREVVADTTPIEPEPEPEPREATPDASVSAAEIESWPSQDASTGLEAPAGPSWPTEPPAAGSGDADTWPTTAPEA
jgi:hypothetical protein